MSRIGKKPIKIPEGVKFDAKEGLISVEGPKGKLTERMNPRVTVSVENGEILFRRSDNEGPSRAAHGAMRSNVWNMIEGVQKGYVRELQINGVGYKAELKGRTLDLHVGFSYPKKYEVPEGIKVEIEKNTKIIVSGIDKRLVGKVASEIRKVRPPEPYKGKGIKYMDEVIKKKVGKAAVTQAT